MKLPTCEVCAHQDDCEIRDSILAVEENHSVKLELNYCPSFEPDEPGALYELMPDHEDPDLFSTEDLA